MVGLNKCIDRKAVLHVYNNLFILQIDICKVTLSNKGNESWRSFLIVSRDDAALLGMLDCKKLQPLSNNCDTIEADYSTGCK